MTWSRSCSMVLGQPPCAQMLSTQQQLYPHVRRWTDALKQVGFPITVKVAESDHCVRSLHCRNLPCLANVMLHCVCVCCTVPFEKNSPMLPGFVKTSATCIYQTALSSTGVRKVVVSQQPLLNVWPYRRFLFVPIVPDVLPIVAS